MKRTLIVLVTITLSVLLAIDESWARGGNVSRGGSASRGGGASRGNSAARGGGVSRGSSGASRSPSMSRATPRPASSRPGGGASTRPAPSRPGAGGAGGRPTIGERPATGDRPRVGEGSLANGRPGTGDRRPGSGSLGDRRPGTGDNRPALGDRRPATGNRPGSGSLADRRPGGDKPSRGDLQDFLDLPGGDKPNLGDRTNLRDRDQQIGDRVNVGDRDNQIGDRTNIGGDRTNVGNRVTAGNRVGDTTINIGSGNTVNRQNNVRAIRNQWTGVNTRPFDRSWWNDRPHTGADWRWHGTWNRYPAGWAWRGASWAACGTWFAWSWPQPMTYDYGNTVVYRDNYVYVDGSQVASTDQYYEQAVSIAQSAPEDVTAEQVEWMPLGVFAIAEESAGDSGMLIQLAVSKQGIVAGTFFNEATEKEIPIEGMVDQKTQRVAWRLADDSNPDLVMETGIYNLTKDETSALVHFGQDQTQTWLMVRLPEPEGDQ